MSSQAIHVESLGKRYRITPAAKGRGRPSPMARLRRTDLWALRDVSFDVEEGSTLGIIGRNGAGKTTLLKILSRVTPPTEGRALLAGRPSALLEVGTGFHPELTGRENVFLNGAILGMRRGEIARKFDEIVAFSEIGPFIDTPVKRYSSGMVVRLASSVAAHLEADILLVDEVLSVADAAFQAKCVRKMDDVTEQGRTVVLVSHNMPTIASLADRCLWLDGGHIRADGRPSDVIDAYLNSFAAPQRAEVSLSERERPAWCQQQVLFAAVRLLGSNGQQRPRFFEGEPIEIELDLDVKSPVQRLELRAYVRTPDNVLLFSSLSGSREADLRPGRYRTSTRIEPNFLSPGRYRIDLSAGSGIPQDDIDDAIRFEIEHSVEGYDDPVLRSDVGRLRFRFPWTGFERL